jgi:hypothetical protein
MFKVGSNPGVDGINRDNINGDLHGGGVHDGASGRWIRREHQYNLITN